MTCIIIDDEPLALQGIENYVANCSSLQSLGSFDNPLDALQFLQTNHVDVLLLDIQMQELSGIELIKQLDNKPLVILITANASFASEAYDLDVIDYLVKPVMFVRFEKAIEKAKDFIELRNKNVVEDFIFAKVNGVFTKINFDDISYIEAMGNYIAVVTNTKNILYQSIKSIEALLPSANFIRVHKSFIINIKNITNFTSDYVVIAGKQITVGRNYKREFKFKLNK
jgi:two-component system, LytTR family, response regulator